MNNELDLFGSSQGAEKEDMPLTRVLFVDTETTGADPETVEICEVALLLATYSGFSRTRDDEVFTSLVKPSIPVPPEASAIHHITNGMLKDEPAIADISGNMRVLVDSADFICAHNLPFDLTILLRQVPDVFGIVTREMELDSLRLARHLWPLVPSHSLQALRYRFELDSDIMGEAHRALFDTELVRALVDHILVKERPDMQGWEQLAEFARSPLDVQVFSFGKYRGKLVEDIVASDVDYIRWLLKQKWMVSEYPDLHHTLLTKTGGK